MSIHASNWLKRLVLLLVIMLAAVMAINQFTPPNVVPASALSTQFSVERELDHLKVIAKKPHPIGSPPNTAVREIKAITLHYLTDVNCYLIKTGDSYILIDTGFSTKRTDFEKELKGAGVRPGNLKLIVLTHGDFDHAGMPHISVKSLVQK